jgi:group I intron endonuclease
MRRSGIYKIQSKAHPERCYVGSAFVFENRWSLHKVNLRANSHHSIILQNHVNKYGIDDLLFYILEPCAKELLLSREQFYIELLNPFFNVCRVAGGRTNLAHSEETKRKISRAHRGIRPGEETRILLSLAQVGNKKALGHKQSEESKQSNRKKHLGKTWTPEHKLLHSLRMKGMNNPFYGKKHTEESRNKIKLTRTNVNPGKQ